jgi:aromatic ring hydroxylase
LRPLFDQFYRGSNGYDAEHRIKLVNGTIDRVKGLAEQCMAE